MATRTKPLFTAALAGAAAIAVSSSVLTPSFNAPSPHALAAAKVQLTTFSDVLSIPAVVWTDVYFGNQEWGNVLGPQTYGEDWAAPADALGQPYYVNPWAPYCNNDCGLDGLSGVGYMFLDALVNGTGNGYDDLDNWKIGIVNYLFEPAGWLPVGGGSSPWLQFNQAGLSAATWYALQGTLGQAIPSLQVPLAGAFWGTLNASIFYNLGVTVLASLAQNVPLVGPVIGNTMLASLGDLQIPGTTDYYQYGLSGVLNYWVDLATGAVPWPTNQTSTSTDAEGTDTEGGTSTEGTDTEGTGTEGTDTEGTDTEGTDTESDPAAAAATGPAPAAAVAVTATDSTPAVVDTPAVSTPAVTAPVVDSPAVTAPVVDSPAVSAPVVDTTPEVSAPVVDSTPEVSAPTVTDTKPVDTTPISVPDVADADVADSAPASAPAAPKRPVRDALDKIGKQVASGFGGARAAGAGAGAATAGAASASSSGSSNSSDSGE